MIVLLILCALIYTAGWKRPVRLVDRRRQWTARHWRAIAYTAGLLLAATVTLPPIDAHTASAFSLLAAQRIVLVMAAAPLMTLGAPLTSLNRLLPGLRASTPRWWIGPAFAFVTFNVVLLLSGLPGFSDAILASAVLRQLTDAALLLAGLIFWAQVIDQPPFRSPLSNLQRVLYLVIASVQVRIFALILGLSPQPFYAHYVHVLGGAAALFDQQFGAGLLLVPGVLSDSIVLTVYLFAWLGSDSRAQRGARLPRALSR
jgi:cytochrome c oxidase assembly factor CtaG